MRVPLSTFVFRAPLLPVSALGQGERALFVHPLGQVALELTSPSLHAAVAGQRHPPPAARASLSRYARRAAFRPTPHGLMAGVGTGTLGHTTRIRTGTVTPWFTVSYSRLASLARGLLEDASLMERVYLRRAPSLFWQGTQATWLARTETGTLETAEAEVDDVLEAILAASETWTPWPILRSLADDDYLLALVDDALLVTDLEPPLVGRPPLEWMQRRLHQLPSAERQAEALDLVATSLAEGKTREAIEELKSLPAHSSRGAGDAPLHAVLVHETPNEPHLSREAVERAAALAPLLFRIQDALCPPAAERALDPALLDSLEGITETLGNGALDSSTLALGHYGSPMPREEPAPSFTAPPAPLLSYLMAAILKATRTGAEEVRLSSTELWPLCPDTPHPPTFELLLTPCTEPPRSPRGTDWLIGLHAPAGATVGRFAAVLGKPLEQMLGELSALEKRARPGEERLDVAASPSDALADLCTHSPVRDAALALVSWPDRAVTPAETELVFDPALLEPMALRASGQPIAPSPLFRVRSTTFPAGFQRLLAGWSFTRQHAPWAFSMSPLFDLPAAPRLVIDGFVVMPRNFQIPSDVAAACAQGRAMGRRAIRRWKEEWSVPSVVQAGHEDELLLVDLDSPDAVSDIAKLGPNPPRAWEIWPPLSRLCDKGGRRVEAVVAVVDIPEGDDLHIVASAIQQSGRAGSVPPPMKNGPAHGWRTFKLFGAEERQDRVLVEIIAPLLEEALARGQVDAWFFLRYVDAPGRREHLRLRVHGTSARALAALERRLWRRLAPARSAGDIVSVEIAEYHREVSRYGGVRQVEIVEGVFESDSLLACELLATPGEADLVELLVRSMDTMARGLGLGLPERLALARRRRGAHEEELGGAPEQGQLKQAYRMRQARLMAVLSGQLEDELSAPLGRHAIRLSKMTPLLEQSEWNRLLASLLHLAAVRLAGTERGLEAQAYYFWERALEGLTHTRATPGNPRRARRN
ncbi:MAG: lantibiotic dehydratase [Deltaproteobacteria bacterium]|nr:lantibiotic dehydratase [Deltaproteobacteria bacterium]